MLEIAVGAGSTSRLIVHICDIAGRRVRTRDNCPYRLGSNHFVWDLRDADGRKAANGVYFIRVAGGESVTRKVHVVR
jgi:flagellar hook assembly protein FlgD